VFFGVVVVKAINLSCFLKLFIELGWDNHAQRHQIAIDEKSFSLSSIAEKRGVQILICTQIPDYLTRKQIETKVTELK